MSTTLGTKRTGRFYLIMLLPMFVTMIVFSYYPIALGARFAFVNYSLYHPENTPFVGFDNFKAVFGDKYVRFSQMLFNTVTWTVFSLAGEFILGFFLALLLRKPFKGRGVYSSLVFYVWAVSGFAIGLL